MTEVMINMAEEQFGEGKYIEAYYTARVAKELDPFFPGVENYASAFLLHALAFHYSSSRRGEPNWYRILGLPHTASPDSVIRSFHRLAKLVDPSHHRSAAAKGAYKLSLQALDVLGDDGKRAAFRQKMGLPKEVSEPTRRTSTKDVDDGAAGSWDVMTQVLLETAEQHFLAGRYTEAYQTAKLATDLDPFCPGLCRYKTAYRIYAVAYHYNRQGQEPNWHQILQLPSPASLASITHSFCRIAKLVDPDGKNRPSTAAVDGAYRLACRAFAALSEAPESDKDVTAPARPHTKKAACGAPYHHHGGVSVHNNIVS